MISRLIWGQSAYRKVVILLLAILLPLYLIGVVIYQWGIKTLQHEISESMTYQVSTSITNLENEFDRVVILLYDALSDTDLHALANIPESMSNIEKMQRTLRLQHRLNAIANSSQYINNVSALIPSIDRNISATTINKLNIDEFIEMRALQFNLDSPLFEYNDNPNLAIGYPFLSPSSKRELTLMLSIEFSNNKLEDHLQGMKKNEGEGLIFSSSSFLLQTNEEALDIEQLIAAVSLKEEEQGSFVWSDHGESYLTVYQMSDLFNGVLIKYIPVSVVFSPLTKFKTYFIILTLTSIVILLMYSMFLFKYIHKPLEKLVRAFRRVETGDMNIRVHHDSKDEFHYIYSKFNDMLDNIRSLFDEMYKQKLLMQKSELKHLQSQINPHFLYNSFFILNTMARLGDTDQLERFTLQLGEYYQFITKNNTDNVLLAKEVQHAKIYAEIQGMRFANRVQIDFADLPDRLGHIMVPRLILQPLIENAFEHAIEKKTGAAILRVKFNKLVDGLELIVEDNGDELTERSIDTLNRSFMLEETNETTGILNIHQRIRLMFGDRSSLRFERSEWNGLKAVITIIYKEG